MKTDKNKFMEYVDLRLREKRYKKHILEQSIIDLQIKGMEKTRRRKIKQF